MLLVPPRRRKLIDDRKIIFACLFACLTLTIASANAFGSSPVADPQGIAGNLTIPVSSDDRPKSDALSALLAKTKKPPVIVSLMVEKHGDIVAIRIKDRVAKVVRMEDGLLHIVSTSRFESPTRAVDF